MIMTTNAYSGLSYGKCDLQFRILCYLSISLIILQTMLYAENWSAYKSITTTTISVR